MEHVDKWYTTIEYIDIDTGEIITKSLAKREYIQLRKTKKIEIIKIIINKEVLKHGNIKYTAECEKNKQTTLW